MNTTLLKLKQLCAVALTAVLAIAAPTGTHAANSGGQDEKVIRILAVGNSFSEDAIEQNLYELAAAEGIKVVIGNLYHGGCSLQQHCEYFQGDKPEYNYRKIVDGVKTDRPQTTLDYALDDEDWDFVSFQQASHYSGLIDTYTPWLERLTSYVRTKVRQDTKFLWHMTWAYAEDSAHDGFKNYGRSQQSMYKAILAATQAAMRQCRFDALIPCGTAIQNARTSAMGDSLCRDGYHLQLVYGRYTAACTWFEAVFGRKVEGNPYHPAGMDSSYRRIAQTAAHKAVRRPFKVSKVK